MPIKEVYTSDPGVYRVLPDDGYDPWASSIDRTRIYDEYIWWVNGVTVIENPESPTDYEIVFFALNHARITQGANVVAMRWSGLTGKFLGHDARQQALGFTEFTSGNNGTTYATNRWILPDNSVHKLDPYTFQFTLLHGPGYYEGDPLLATVPCIDEEADVALFIAATDNNALREIGVYRESTGEFLYKFKVCGVPESIFMADDRRAYTVANDGTLTLFSYITGQVLSVLHVGLTDNERVWSWDRVSKRILCFERTPDTMPEGTCTCRVRGYYPIPVAHGMAGPIPLQVPRVGRRVEFLSKVYGAAGEGVPGVVVNYSLETALGIVVAPIQHTTDLNGNSRTYVTSSLAGSDTLTATAQV
jgi:hypothetical protein